MLSIKTLKLGSLLVAEICNWPIQHNPQAQICLKILHHFVTWDNILWKFPEITVSKPKYKKIQLLILKQCIFLVLPKHYHSQFLAWLRTCIRVHCTPCTQAFFSRSLGIRKSHLHVALGLVHATSNHVFSKSLHLVGYNTETPPENVFYATYVHTV